MTKNNWEYGGLYQKHNMEGEINIGGGILKVHDIFEPLPNFMKQSDCIFSDPPCSVANINAFYTKADREDYQKSFDPFTNRFFECIDEIQPTKVFLEVFKSNKDTFLLELQKRYKNVKIINSYYYHKPTNTCKILYASNEPLEQTPNDIDEEDFIKWVCQNINYDCIGDLCMGTGLIGWYSFLNNKKFVGTEINKKRLGILVDKIKNHKEKNKQ